MKKHAFDLNNLGLAPMSDLEMLTTDGGELPKWLRTFGVGWLIDQIISNYDEIRQGASQGWNSVHYR